MPFWYIIVNPAAGNGAVGRRWPEVERILQALGFSYTVKYTEYRGHATRLVEDAVLKGHRYLLGVGGDGTNHEMANGILAQTAVPSTDITYALLPIGTGNDWARQYDIPRDPQARLQRLLEGRTLLQDAGKITYQTETGQTAVRYFINVAGMAYDAYIARQLDRHRLMGRLHYLLLVGQYLFRYRLCTARLLFDGHAVTDYFYTINIGLCRYSGGGMQLVPHAVPDDGLFAFTFARALPKWEVLRQTPRFYNGTFTRHPKVEGYQTKMLRVEQAGPTPTLLEADGEFLGTTPVVFELLEKALRVAL